MTYIKQGFPYSHHVFLFATLISLWLSLLSQQILQILTCVSTQTSK